jgi:hypothetical protein
MMNQLLQRQSCDECPDRISCQDPDGTPTTCRAPGNGMGRGAAVPAFVAGHLALLPWPLLPLATRLKGGLDGEAA